MDKIVHERCTLTPLIAIPKNLVRSDAMKYNRLRYQYFLYNVHEFHLFVYACIRFRLKLSSFIRSMEV